MSQPRSSVSGAFLFLSLARSGTPPLTPSLPSCVKAGQGAWPGGSQTHPPFSTRLPLVPRFIPLGRGSVAPACVSGTSVNCPCCRPYPAVFSDSAESDWGIPRDFHLPALSRTPVSEPTQRQQIPPSSCPWTVEGPLHCTRAHFLSMDISTLSSLDLF